MSPICRADVPKCRAPVAGFAAIGTGTLFLDPELRQYEGKFFGILAQRPPAA